MSWFKIAFGLIREAVATEAGQEVISKVGSAMRKEPSGGQPPNQPTGVDVEALLVEYRAQVERNLETIVHMVNAQNRQLQEINRRQRIWNISLAVGLGIASLLAVLALFRG
jgi:hypothetical protein